MSISSNILMPTVYKMFNEQKLCAHLHIKYLAVGPDDKENVCVQEFFWY